MSHQNFGSVPIIGQTRQKAELVFLGPCPHCGNAFFAHGPSDDMPPALLPTCKCPIDAIEAALPRTYDPERERRVVVAVFSLLDNLITITNAYGERYGALESEVSSDADASRPPSVDAIP